VGDRGKGWVGSWGGRSGIKFGVQGGRKRKGRGRGDKGERGGEGIKWGLGWKWGARRSRGVAWKLKGGEGRGGWDKDVVRKGRERGKRRGRRGGVGKEVTDGPRVGGDAGGGGKKERSSLTEEW